MPELLQVHARQEKEARFSRRYYVSIVPLNMHAFFFDHRQDDALVTASTLRVTTARDR